MTIEKFKMYILNNKRKIMCIALIAFTLIIVGLIYYSCYLKNNNVENIVLNETEKKEETLLKGDISKDNVAIKYIYIDIKGYVNKPGVYKFDESENKRVWDLIEQAGGLKKDADTTTINMSLRLKDEMVIRVYSKKEINDFLATKKKQEEKLEICIKDSVKNDGCITSDTIDNKENLNNKININTANKSELTTLNGIGESKADDIINYRNNVGFFVKIEDIKNVEGIGDSVFEKIKDFITIQ